MVSRPKLRVGDVFTIPVDCTRVGVGQVVATYLDSSFYFALFEPLYSPHELPALEEAVAQRVAFLAISFDARVAKGPWSIVGHCRVQDDMPLPAFKEMVGGPGRVDVVDFSGTRRRRARGDETRWLSNRKVVSPLVLEEALKARHGVEPWNDTYASLEPNYATTTARLFDQPE
jgi:hypothetical protein